MAAKHYSVIRPGLRIIGELHRKNSQFLTILSRADSPAQAQELLSDCRHEYRDAAHHCSAWVIGHDRRIQRANDDGEPSGTAGAPMLEALVRAEMPSGEQDLADVVAVVIRWFGGTLLGTGGLVSAYSDAVLGALEQAHRENAFILRGPRRMFVVEAPIGEAGRWEHELRSCGLVVTDTDYLSRGGVALIRIAVEDSAESLQRLTALVSALQGHAAAMEDLGVEWADQ